MAPVKQALQDSKTAAAGIIEDTVPEDQRTGDLNKDLRTAARAAGIERVPAEAEIDQLNTAIMGAKLGAAIAGSYVDPNTGEELRPTAGARIGQAVAEGLAFRRDTETRRAQQEAELAKARIAARARTAGKTGKGWFDTAEGKYFTKLVEAALPLVGGTNISEAYDRVAQEHPELVARARMEISNMGLDTSANPPPEGNVNMSSPDTSANPPPEGNVAKDTRSGKIVGDSPFYVGQEAINPVTGEMLIYTETGWQTPMKTN
jgi:hypothetical protein